MKNLFLDTRSAADIDKVVDKIHRDLGKPEKKVELAQVRELLRLDLGFYSPEDPGLLKEVIHKLRVGAKQVAERPSLLIDVVRRFDLQALFIPDRKRILIDSSMPDLKKRWSEGHEILHSLIPWHSEYTLGDNKKTLSMACEEQIEAEANYGTGRLLFPPYSFAERAQSEEPSLSAIKELAADFGNTITTTLWRYVESSSQIMFGVVSQHPRYPTEGEPRVAYFIRSPAFEHAFRNVTEEDAFALVGECCDYRKRGPLGQRVVLATDDRGVAHEFLMECFSNSHQVLTLARNLRTRSTLVAAT